MEWFPKTRAKITEPIATPIRRTGLLALGAFVLAFVALIVAVAR